MLSFTVVLLMSVSSSMAIEYRYEASADLANFADAQAKCTAKGGELAVPESKAEEASIAAAVSAADVDWSLTAFSSHKFYWLNIEEDVNNAPLSELTYTNYHKSQPNRPSEKCVAAAAAKENQWSDRPCEAATAYVCQYENIDMKCWKNKMPQQLTKLEGTNEVLDKQNYKKRADSIIKCQVAAQEGGYDFFALGNGGQCWAGHGDDYKKQGQVAKCPAHGKGKYGVVNVYAIISEPVAPTTTAPTTTAPPTTTPAPTTPAPPTTTPAQYRYEAFSELVNFADAQAKCTAKGAELALPESKTEEASIAAAVSAVEVDWSATAFSTHQFYWLNIEEDAKNAPLSELTYTNYHSSQPNRASEKCVAAAAAKDNVWSDRPCDAVTPYVCQYDLTKTTTTPTTTTKPLLDKGEVCKSNSDCKSNDCAKHWWYHKCQ